MADQNTQEKGNQGTSQRTSGQQSGAQATQAPQQLVRTDEEHRSASNVPSNQTAPEQEYADYALSYDEDDAAFDARIPDVLLDAPVVKLENIDFELDNLRAKVSLFAKVLDLMELSVGIDAYLGKVKLSIESLEIQALLKVRLDNVRAILDRVLTTINRNPQFIHELANDVGSAVEDVGEGAGETVEDVGEGARQLAGEGVSEAVEDIGEGAAEAVEDVGGGAGEAVGEVGQSAGQATQQAGEAAQQAGRVAQGATGATGQTAEQAQDDGVGQGGQRETNEREVPNATRAARREAEKLGVDLSQIEGSGAGGRITVRDVHSAAQKV